jgi:hypothetical protein
MHPDEDIFERRDITEQPDRLKGSPDPQAIDLEGFQASDILASERNAPGRRSVQAGDNVEEGRLPRPVRADQSADFALL